MRICKLTTYKVLFWYSLQLYQSASAQNILTFLPNSISTYYFYNSFWSHLDQDKLVCFQTELWCLHCKGVHIQHSCVLWSIQYQPHSQKYHLACSQIHAAKMNKKAIRISLCIHFWQIFRLFSMDSYILHPHVVKKQNSYRFQALNFSILQIHGWEYLRN